MIVYTLLFTLVGKSPAENRYVDMFYIWLSFLLKNGGLTTDDRIHVLVDQATIDYFNEDGIFSNLLEAVHCPINFILINQPNNLSEGITSRYTTTYIDTTALFLDLDILVLNPIRLQIPDLEPDELAIIPEGRMSYGLYCGDLLPAELTEGICGFTAGCFAFRPGTRIEEFFGIVSKECLESVAAPKYTIDQPFFNKWICLILKKEVLPLKIRILDNSIMDNNSYTLPSGVSATFMNYAGDPGVDKSHFKKLLAMISISHIRPAPQGAAAPVPQEAGPAHASQEEHGPPPAA